MSQNLGSEFDGVLFANWRIEGDNLVREVKQPSRERILNFNAEVQKQPDIVRELEWGAMAMNIPEQDLQALQKQYPDLNCKDGEIRTRAWMKFYNSSESIPYRVRARSLARG